MLYCVQGQLSSAKAELALEIHKKMKHASSDKRQVYLLLRVFSLGMIFLAFCLFSSLVKLLLPKLLILVNFLILFVQTAGTSRRAAL